MIAPRAFAYNVERKEIDIRLLVGHRFDKPLASRGAGTLTLTDADDALTFDAIVTEGVQETTWAKDFFAGFAAGLITGLSPGFRIPPARVSPNAEKVEEEDPAEGMAIIRTIFDALLFELSMVTSAAYPEAEVQARNWTPGLVVPARPKLAGAYRWR